MTRVPEGPEARPLVTKGRGRYGGKGSLTLIFLSFGCHSCR